MLNGVPGIFVTVDILTLLLLKVFLYTSHLFQRRKFSKGSFSFGPSREKSVFARSKSRYDTFQ